MNEQELNVQEVNEITELNNQFAEFLKTKGIKAKFKLAFSNMKESAKKQYQADVKNFNEVKAKSIEENREFYEFLNTKGFKAKVKLVIENIKKGAREAKNKPIPTYMHVNQVNLENELNHFLRTKNLDKKYTIKIEEVK